MPIGMAVRASPKLWIRSASSATLSVRTNRSVWANAVSPRTARLAPTARSPARERRMLGSKRPCE